MLKRVVRFLYCQKIDLHSDILSLKEIQNAIKQVVETPEDQFIKQIKEGQYNPKLWVKIKSHYIHPDDAVKIVKAVSQQYQPATTDLIGKNQTSQELLKNDIYNYFMKYFSKRYEKLTFSQIATILEQYAFVKRFDQEFFRIMENEIHDRLSDKDEVIKYQDVEKVLWAYQYCHAGSAILYGQLASIIRIAQHEINPMKLAYYSYLYSKCPDNQKGGFGVYALTEKQTMLRIRDYKFADFVKLAKYIFTPNICSNDFQVKIEEQLAEQFPPSKSLQPADLVKLCKSTINYYYKYNDKALYHKIEGACIELIDKVNEKQFCQILWSYLKSRKGNAELYEKFLAQLKFRQNMLSIRQLAILYLNSSNNPETYDITKSLNEIIIKRAEWGKQEIKPTYLAYITIASMQARLPFALKLTSDHLKVLSIPMKLAILQTLQISLPNKDQLELSILIIKDLQEQQLDYEDLVILRYSEQYFYKFCEILPIKLKPAIHKQLFHQAFYLDPVNEHFHNQLLMLYQQYNNEMRFFFKQDHWIVISWCLLQEQLLNKQRVIKKEILEEACMGIKELDINTVFNVEKYIQSLWMVIILEKLSLDIGVERVQQYFKVQSLAQTTVLLNNYKDQELLPLKEVLKTSLEEQCSQINLTFQYSQSYINMFDQDIGLMLPVAYLMKTKAQDLKFGLILLDEQDIQSTENIQEKLGQQDYQVIQHIRKEIQISKLIFEQLFNWNIEYIHKSEFQKFSQEQQKEYLQKVFQLSPLDDEDLETKKTKRKSLSFADKLNYKKLQQKNSYNQEKGEFDIMQEQVD